MNGGRDGLGVGLDGLDSVRGWLGDSGVLGREWKWGTVGYGIGSRTARVFRLAYGATLMAFRRFYDVRRMEINHGGDVYRVWAR